MARPSRELAAALIATLVSRVVVLALLLTDFWDTPFVSHMVQDLRTWHGFFVDVRAGLLPYVDFSKEYPVGAGILYWILSPLVAPEDLRRTVLVHGAAMGLVDLLNTVLAYRLLRTKNASRALPYALLFSLNGTALLLGPIRFESVLVLFVLLGYAAHVGRRPLAAVALWSLGFWIKWIPGLLIAAQERLALARGRRWGRVLLALAVFSAVALGMNAPFAILSWDRAGTLDPLLAPWRFHLQRPLYWDTLLGVGQIWFGPLPWERYASVWTLGLVLAALLVRPGLRLEARAVLLCISAIVFNRIYSAQFHLWFYPFLLLLAIDADDAARLRLIRLGIVLDLLNVAVFPLSFTLALAEMRGFEPYAAVRSGAAFTVLFSAAIVARTVALVGLAAEILRSRGAGDNMDSQ